MEYFYLVLSLKPDSPNKSHRMSLVLSVKDKFSLFSVFSAALGTVGQSLLLEVFSSIGTCHITSLVFLLASVSVLLHFFFFFYLYLNTSSCPSYLSLYYTLSFINYSHSHVFTYHLLVYAPRFIR